VKPSIAASILIAALLTCSGGAQATVSPGDEATEVIRLTQRDGSGGVRVTKAARENLSKAALRSVDV
jgi:hypothetical protein